MSDSVLNFSCIEIDNDSVVPDIKECLKSGNDYVSWGSNNKFPQELYDMYMNCSILQSIINGIVDYTVGGGVVSAWSMVNENDEILDLIKKITYDYVIFGGFAVQIMKKGDMMKFYYTDFTKCRRNEDETKVYFANEWGKFSKKCLEYDSWTPNFKSGTCIFYYKGQKTRGVYPVPMYVAALKSIKTATEITNFHLNNISRGFASNAIISFNNGDVDADTKANIEKGIKEKFCGTNNAGSFLLLFNESKDNAAEIARIQDDKFDLKYDALSKNTKEDIFIAFRATPELFGFPSENNGFSATEFIEAFNLFNKTVVMPIQKELERQCGKIGLKIDFKEFKLDKDKIDDKDINDVNQE